MPHRYICFSNRVLPRIFLKLNFGAWQFPWNKWSWYQHGFISTSFLVSTIFYFFKLGVYLNKHFKVPSVLHIPGFSLLQPSEMASFSHYRWQNRPYRSTNIGDIIVKKAKRLWVGEGESLWHLSNYREAELLKNSFLHWL